MKKFKEYYKEEKELLDNKISELNKKLLTEDDEIIEENLSLLRNLNSGGKLIRGILINLGYYLLKDNKEYSTELSLAYELFETSILIHDDIIDNDSKRRGKDTIQFATINKYKDIDYDKNELKNLGNNIAICMGDYGLYLSNKIITDAYSKDKTLPRLLSYFNDIVLKTIKGELLDVVLPFKSKTNLIEDEKLEDNILKIYKLKTAHYTIIGPLSLGLILAGADNNKLNDIEEYAENIGIAFQIQDDLLGIYSDNIGKVVGSDIKEFKQTILYSYTCNTKYKEELLKYYGHDDITVENINKVRKIFTNSGAKDYAYNLMNKLYDKAESSLNNIKWIKEDKKELLQGFVEYLRNRNK